MGKITSVLLFLFTLAGCVTNPSGPVDPTIEDKLAKAIPEVKFVRPDDAQRCGPEESCSFIANVYCDGREKQTEKDCEKQIREKVIKAGGDTFVVSTGGVMNVNSISYPDDYYRIHGLVFRCSEKFKDLHAAFGVQNKKQTGTENTITSSEYFIKCMSQKKCQFITRQTCSSIRVEPFGLCMQKVLPMTGIYKTPETLVIREDLFNNAGSYRMFFDSYICNP